MTQRIHNIANHTGRTARPVLAVVDCAPAPGFYFGYWFSH
ncbi:hypothetical protein CCOS865_02939 [Pseudomonas reidholzensis]|uniref:Uncharacterized protein n=1 Tax=Pseudomonas reidholzensis TaxID=1785162 RepID=A0A383RUF6_9PSED|nr:hypothetical protein CCOS865_02939 [Pseudomonas reidholzensis]